MKFIYLGRLLFVAFLVSGCTIVTYDLRDELAETETQPDCEISFVLELQSEHATNTLGTSPHDLEVIEEIRGGYVSQTVDTLSDLGCNVTEVSGASEPNLSISISRQLQLSALPQEWLTGLSFGLIPSWGTKYGQYTFTFTNADTGRAHTYKVDQNSYNHLILFPVFWITFLTANEEKAYANALSNFVKSS